jgi:hypothetical protein
MVEGDEREIWACPTPFLGLRETVRDAAAGAGAISAMLLGRMHRVLTLGVVTSGRWTGLGH